MEEIMENKVVIITGSRRGLGKETAIKFAREGYNVVVNDKNGKEELEAVVNYINENFDVKCLGFFGDISKEENVLELKEQVLNSFGQIDVLVNNAADVTDMEIEERSTELFNQTLINNVTSTYLMSKYIGKEMYNRKKGKIINISSTNGINTFFPTSIDYDASKAGIISLTHNFALEYAPYVLVNSIAPGWINTEMNKQLPEDLIEEETSKIYLKRFAEPEEVAELILFLANDKCSYINGEIIKIDGGY
jgi:3-oxoacyl-[acyl-carrier protein] reductase